MIYDMILFISQHIYIHALREICFLAMVCYGFVNLFVTRPFLTGRGKISVNVTSQLGRFLTVVVPQLYSKSLI
jgi:hypothetical protein